MFPGMGGINPRQMQKMMAQMGIKNTEIPAREVIIRKEDGEIIISNPSVTVIEMKGQPPMYQISGDVSERTALFKEEDVKLVMEQTGKPREAVEAALTETNGDIAEAILKLQG